MIRLTRLRQTDPLYLNPDHIERLEHHHQTVVRLLNGNEYVVCESPDEIVDQVVMLRARSIALAARLAADDLDARVGVVSHEVSLAAGTAPLPEVSSVDHDLRPGHPTVRPPDTEG